MTANKLSFDIPFHSIQHDFSLMVPGSFSQTSAERARCSGVSSLSNGVRQRCCLVSSFSQTSGLQ